MKRFTLFMLLALTVGSVMTLAAMPKEKKVVKVEVLSVMGENSPVAVTPALDLMYIAAPSGEVIADFKPPTVIGQLDNAYKTSIFHTPSTTNESHLLPDIRRLSWDSVVAGSDRHI